MAANIITIIVPLQYQHGASASYNYVCMLAKALAASYSCEAIDSNYLRTKLCFFFTSAFVLVGLFFFHQDYPHKILNEFSQVFGCMDGVKGQQGAQS